MTANRNTDKVPVTQQMAFDLLPAYLHNGTEEREWIEVRQGLERAINASPELTALIAENERMREDLAKRQWQPIETANKQSRDGILVLSEHGQHEAWWNDYRWRTCVQSESDEYPPLTCTPTHWQPLLPEPPKGETK